MVGGGISHDVLHRRYRTLLRAMYHSCAIMTGA
jgi:uncharacterized membrane protein YeiH